MKTQRTTPAMNGLIMMTLAVGLTAGGGLLQGSYARRWGNSEQEAQLARRLREVPRQFAGWTQSGEYEIGEAADELLEPAGYLHRTYVSATGERVNVAVILGAHGPISVHTPEVCYDSRDYQQVNSREAVTIRDTDGRKTTFWTVSFNSPSVERTGLRVYYAWSPTAEWEAVSSPRLWFLGQPYLFKIQLACGRDSKDSDSPEGDVGRRFLADFVPVLRHQLFHDS